MRTKECFLASDHSEWSQHLLTEPVHIKSIWKRNKKGARCNINQETFKINPKKIHYRNRSPKQDCYTCLENIWTMLKDNPLKWFNFISSYLKRFRTSKPWSMQIKIVSTQFNRLYNKVVLITYRFVSSSSKQMHKWRWYTK